MGFIVNEQKMVEDNIFKFENRLKSPVSRFLDSTPTFVTYYHIDSDTSTVDGGFLDVSAIIGKRSPIKYKKIDQLPLYGLDQILLQIQENDQGLDTSYEGEVVVAPGTITPLPNDMFTIPYLQDSYLFRVTEIFYDTVMPDNFYKLSYKLEYIDDEKIDDINDQVNSKFTCILQNIGTDDRCIIESDYKETIDKIDIMYNDMVETYMAIFYNERHNCLLGELGPNQFIYDPLQSEFINKHQLFNKKNNLESTMLTVQFEDNKRRVKYEKSVYRFMERRDYRLADNFKFTYFNGFDNEETSFFRWHEKNIMIADIPLNPTPLVFNTFSDELVASIKVNGFTQSKYAELIQKFIRNDDITIHDIPLSLNEELITLNASLEVFLITPLLLYIIKTIVNDFMSKK